MRLFLLRHAKANENLLKGKDFDRFLSKKGSRQAKLIRSFLKVNFQDEKFDVHCSKARRTHETFKLIEEYIDVNHFHLTEDLYLASYKELLNYINKIEIHEKNLLIIGHNNGLSELASYFLGEKVQLPTCGLIVLDFPFDKATALSKDTATEVNRFFPQATTFTKFFKSK